MSKRYEDKDGMWLAVCETREGFRVGWYDTEERSVEAFTDDSPVPPLCEGAPSDKSTWENWTAYWAMKPLADDVNPLRFISEAKAKKALLAANDALNNGGAPWPEWATLAKAAGWTAPKGWKA